MIQLDPRSLPEALQMEQRRTVLHRRAARDRMLVALAAAALGLGLPLLLSLTADALRLLDALAAVQGIAEDTPVNP